MPDPTNDLRAFAMHQKSKEPPEVPRITKEEAAILANDGKSFDDAWDSLTDSGMLEFSLTDGDVVDVRASPLGRAALAQFEAEQRAEIERPLRTLLEDIYDSLDGYVDVVDSSDGRPSPNFAMSIRMSIDVALGRHP